MALRHWLAGLAVVVGLGLLKVAERNALLLQGSLLGERMSRLHETESEMGWARARVATLRSPMRLSMIAQERYSTLVAWSTLPASLSSPAVHGSTTVPHALSGAGEARGARPLKLSREDRP